MNALLPISTRKFLSQQISKCWLEFSVTNFCILQSTHRGVVLPQSNRCQRRFKKIRWHLNFLISPVSAVLLSSVFCTLPKMNKWSIPALWHRNTSSADEREKLIYTLLVFVKLPNAVPVTAADLLQTSSQPVAHSVFSGPCIILFD